MKPNIAIVTPLQPTYSETFLRAHLERLPFQVHHFYGLPKMGYHPIYDGAGRPLSSDAKWFNYLETGLDTLFGESGIGYTLRRRAMLNYFREHQIKAVLAEYGPTGTYVMDACAQAQIPLLVHYHGRDAYHYKTLQRFAAKYRRMFVDADTILPVSTDMQQQLASLGAKPEKMLLNPYGPNPTFFTYQELPDSRPPVFLSVGRFTAKKAPHLTIHAFARVQAAVPAAKLIMLGDGELWEESKKLAQDLGVLAHIDFAGPRTPAQIASIHHQVRVFVQHSVRAIDGDSEGTPVAILEAMKSGLPIVSTRHAGIKDVVLEAETGYLVEEGDWEAMAEAMLHLAKDPALAAEMGKKGNARVEAHYTMEQHIQRLATAIQTAIDKKNVFNESRPATPN
jgi:glycosyltransferase involved in cell wall biosynthesis